jgi:hypothetical protein
MSLDFRARLGWRWYRDKSVLSTTAMLLIDVGLGKGFVDVSEGERERFRGMICLRSSDSIAILLNE